MSSQRCDYLIVGAGIVGLAMARCILTHKPAAKILIIDKEQEIAQHASGRNSGVLHAGFYYTADSLKARFTVAGNRAMRDFCEQNSLPINACGKLVVAQNEFELAQLYELEKRGLANGSSVEIIDQQCAIELEPNVRTFKKALYSPFTATVDPKLLCAKLKQILLAQGVQFKFSSAYLRHSGDVVETQSGAYQVKKLINCAGLYADKIAHDYGLGLDYTVLPFKGLYLKYVKNKTDVGMHIYPVPNLKNPFLGVHFTKTVDGTIKIGPTAIPAFWRENYSLFERFKLSEFVDIAWSQIGLFANNSFNFRSLALEEMKKYMKPYFISLAQALVQHIDTQGFGEYTPPGIRAQLLHRNNMQLVQDFLVEADKHSVHILNAVSPGLTCAFPFSDYVFEKYVA